MSDTKLREKADALIAFTQLGPRFVAWVQAVTDALAPEKAAKVCGNCGEKVSSLSDHVTCAETGDYYCQPAPPAPAKVECPNCGEMTSESHADGILFGAVNYTCQPAPPEPAAPVNGSTPVGEYDPDMKPAAREMTTIRPYTAKDVRAWIAARGYLSAEQYNDFGRVLPTSNMGACMEALAEALEEIERNLAQPGRWG